MQKTAFIKNIIFDLGGVLLNIEPKLTGAAFIRMGVQDMDNVIERLLASRLFQRFDSGNCTATEFRQEIRKACGIPLTDEQVDEAWNALLLDFPLNRVNLLRSLSQHYRVFLLSNTNCIHFPVYTSRFRAEYGQEMTSLFEKLFLSYEMGCHKPDPEIYQLALSLGNLKASETLFIDDVKENAEAAVKAGMAAFHLADGIEVTSLFENGMLRNDEAILFPE